MYEFWYDYVKPKDGEKAKLWIHGYGHFIVYIDTDDIYKNFTEDVETRFDTSDYELDRPFPNEKNRHGIRFMKEVLESKIKICWIQSKHLQLFNRWR